MTVDSRAKGARAETDVRDKLRQLTGLQWERVPSSGALDPKHGLKGDVYLVGVNNAYCVEIKHYKDDHLTSSLLTAKNPQLIEWWKQTLRESKQVDKYPLLIFKHDRSKLFCAFCDLPTGVYNNISVAIDEHFFTICLLDDFIEHERPKFIK